MKSLESIWLTPYGKIKEFLSALKIPSYNELVDRYNTAVVFLISNELIKGDVEYLTQSIFKPLILGANEQLFQVAKEKGVAVDNKTRIQLVKRIIDVSAIQLPLEIMERIMMNMDLEDLSKFCIANKEINAICNTDDFWIRKAVYENLVESRYHFGRTGNWIDRSAKEEYSFLHRKKHCDPMILLEKYRKKEYIEEHIIKCVMDMGIKGDVNSAIPFLEIDKKTEPNYLLAFYIGLGVGNQMKMLTNPPEDLLFFVMAARFQFYGADRNNPRTLLFNRKKYWKKNPRDIAQSILSTDMVLIAPVYQLKPIDLQGDVLQGDGAYFFKLAEAAKLGLAVFNQDSNSQNLKVTISDKTIFPGLVAAMTDNTNSMRMFGEVNNLSEPLKLLVIHNLVKYSSFQTCMAFVKYVGDLDNLIIESLRQGNYELSKKFIDHAYEHHHEWLQGIIGKYFIYGIQGNNLETVKYLVSKFGKDKLKNANLLDAIVPLYGAEMIKYLKGLGLVFNSEFIWDMLRVAFNHDDLEVVKIIVTDITDLNDHKNMHRAMGGNEIPEDTIQFLLGQGWIPDINSLLYYLVENDNLFTIRSLKNLGFDLSLGGQKPSLAEKAIHHDREEILEYLLSLGFNPNEFVTNGMTLLMYSVLMYRKSHNAELAKHLIKYGADINTVVNMNYEFKDILKNGEAIWPDESLEKAKTFVIGPEITAIMLAIAVTETTQLDHGRKFSISSYGILYTLLSGHTFKSKTFQRIPPWPPRETRSGEWEEINKDFQSKLIKTVNVNYPVMVYDDFAGQNPGQSTYIGEAANHLSLENAWLLYLAGANVNQVGTGGVTPLMRAAGTNGYQKFIAIGKNFSLNRPDFEKIKENILTMFLEIGADKFALDQRYNSANDYSQRTFIHNIGKMTLGIYPGDDFVRSNQQPKQKRGNFYYSTILTRQKQKERASKMKNEAKSRQEVKGLPWKS